MDIKDAKVHIISMFTLPNRVMLPYLSFQQHYSYNNQGHFKIGRFKEVLTIKLTYPACFYQDMNDGTYVVVVPDLPGCVSGGDTIADAIIMATDAASGWVLTKLENGRPVPLASAINTIKPDIGGFVSMLALDIDAYAVKYGDKAVRKNLTIPAWLNTFAEAHHINFSQVLQDSLTKIYRKQQAYSYNGTSTETR